MKVVVALSPGLRGEGLGEGKGVSFDWVGKTLCGEMESLLSPRQPWIGPLWV